MNRDTEKSHGCTEGKCHRDEKFYAHQRKAATAGRAALLGTRALYGEYDWDERVRKWLRENPHVYKQ